MRLLFAICEGAHDVAFVRRSARILSGFVPFEKPLGEYPIPLGAGSRGTSPAQFLVARVRRTRPEMETIGNAVKPLLPALEGALHHAASDTLLLLIRTHGMDRNKEVATFLDEFFDTYDAVATPEITESATAFFVDADDAGRDARATSIAAFFGASWGIGKLSPATWVLGQKRGPLGAFVFCAPASTTGSLEDTLAPLMKVHNGVYWAAAEAFIDGHAASGARVHRAARYRLKAVITAAGQFERPGHPMSEMLQYNALPSSIFQTSPEAQRVADFLSTVPWR